MLIYAAMLEAMKGIAERGIAKLSKNRDQGYNFRGIEAAMNEMTPVLIRNKIIVVPTYTEHHEAERETKSGGKMKFVRVKGVFKFVCVEDGSSVESVFWGEGSDVSDKATTKAQSVAFRTALFQTFVVPTQAIDPEDDDGADDDGDKVADLLEGHIKELRLLDTDAAALGYWNKHKAELAQFPQAYNEFKDAAIAHRKAISARVPA